MGQRIYGFVGTAEAIDALERCCDVRIRIKLAQAYEFVPLTARLSDSLRDSESKQEPDPVGLWLSAGEVAVLVHATSGGKAIAYIDSDFAGGSGLQSGAVWRDGAVIFRTNCGTILRTNTEETRVAWPCNAVLRELMGSDAPAWDYFMSLKLTEVASMEEYLPLDPDPQDPFYS